MSSTNKKVEPAQAATSLPAATSSSSPRPPEPGANVSEAYTTSLCTEAELSAWRNYQTNRVGYADMLQMVSADVDKSGAASADSGAYNQPPTVRPVSVKHSDIAENLRVRWKAQLPFTSVGHQLLVVVNPYDAVAKKIAIAKDTTRLKQESESHLISAADDGTFVLLGKADRDLLISDPRGNCAVHEHSQSHIFSLATRAFWHMLQEKQNQVILFSGESGSGKTQMAKLVVRQLAHLSNTYALRVGRLLYSNKQSHAAALLDPSAAVMDSRVPQRLLSTLELVESLTHASTIFNSNSSRVHTYTELQFNRCGKLVGAKIVDLLLERRRECKGFPFAKGERNFHLFYDMFVQGVFGREERERYALLETPRAYKYLQYDGSVKRGKARDYESTRTQCNLKNVLRGCGFGAKKQDDIFKLISVIMLLGNLEFAENELKRDEASYVKNTDCLEKCAALLGLYPDVLETTLTQRTSTVGVTLCADFLKPAQARLARDDFVVALYRLLFDYLVESVNARLDSSKNDERATVDAPSWDYWVSLFDFGGLENHAIYSGDSNGTGNRFFQFMTNYADERMCEWTAKQVIYTQQKLPNDMSRTVLDETRAEIFSNFNGCITTFVHNSRGLIPILDAETLRALNGKSSLTDGLQLTDLYTRLNQSVSKRQAMFGRTVSEALDSVSVSFLLQGHTASSFGVKHYGGISTTRGQSAPGLKVCYDSADFIADNKLGGRGEGSQALSADYARLIMGTADFPASRNPFLISIVSRLVDMKTHPLAGRTIVSAVRKTEEGSTAHKLAVTGTAGGGELSPASRTSFGSLKRMPSMRRNNDDRRLAHIINDSIASADSTTVHSPLAKQAMITAFNNRRQSTMDPGALAINTDMSSPKINPSPKSARLESPGIAGAGGQPESPAIAATSQLSLPPMAQTAVPTAASAFCSDLNSILGALSEAGSHRLWNVLCIKPNDERSPTKFSEDRVKEQLRRLNIGHYITERCGTYTRAMTWLEFLHCYNALDGAEASTAAAIVKKKTSRHAKRISLMSLSSNQESLKEKCLELYEMYGLVTRAGSGKAQVSGGRIYMDERSWWAMERNLASIQLQKRLAVAKLKPAAPLSNDNDDTRSIATVDSNVSNEDLDKKFFNDINQQIVEMKKREHDSVSKTITPDRRTWLRVTKFLTWWIPTLLIRKLGGMESPDVIQAWREKVALNVIIIFLSSIMLFIITGFGTLLCPTQYVFSLQDLKDHSWVDGNNYVAIHGDVYDMSAFSGTHNSLAADNANGSTALYSYAGKDASILFPTRNGKWGDGNSRCGFGNSKTISNSPWTQCASQFCHNFSKFSQNVYYKSISVFKIGNLAIAMDDVKIHNSLDPDQTYWTVIDSRVYDFTEGMKDDIFPTVYKNALQLSVGAVASGSNSAILHSSDIKACLDEQFFVGVVDERGSEQCVAASYSLLALTVILCLVMVSKFLGALQFGATRRPEEIDRYVILQVPCYTEGEESLKKTINSLALLDYDDSKKLLLVIADGLIKGSGNDRMTPEIVLDILGVENSHEKLTSDAEVPRFDYIALGDGLNRHNRAKVFSGIYTLYSHRVPYLVVVKCGKESETRRPGNRGKRDSQMIMMKFLNKSLFERPMVPLEVEMYRHINDLMGVDPVAYEYCLMVDADTEVMPDSLSRLTAVMLHDSLIMGVCGETEIGNPMDSWVSMIQVYEYYMSHHLAKAFESLFGSVTCLPGCFSMYRIRTNSAKKMPLLVDDQIIHEYEENNVDTLHKKNLLSLGEDRYLTTLMLKFFPEFRTKFTYDAACRTIVPEKFAVLLSQRRRWINSTVHNLFELLRVGQLCGCLCFSMRMIIFLDLFATLVMPASLGYLAYLIYVAVKAKTAMVIAESLYLFAAVYGLQAVIFLFRMKWDMIGWMAIYLLSLPVYGLILPMYAFWHFDDFTWGNTRSVHGEQQIVHGSGGDAEVFDEKIILQTDAKTYGHKGGENAPQSTAIQKTVTNKSNSESREIRPVIAASVRPNDVEPINVPTIRPESAQSSAMFYPQSHVGSIIAPPMFSVPGPYSYPATYSHVSYSYPAMYHGYPPQQYYAYPAPGPAMWADDGSSRQLYVNPAQPYPGMVTAGNVERQNTITVGGNVVDTPVAPTVTLRDGLPVSMFPLPKTIPLCLARVIYAEVKVLLQTMDLNTLTKRTVREAVEINIAGALDEIEGAADESEETSNLSMRVREDEAVMNDLRRFSAMGLDLDFEVDPAAASWVNLCIGEVLKQIASGSANKP